MVSHPHSVCLWYEHTIVFSVPDTIHNIGTFLSSWSSIVWSQGRDRQDPANCRFIAHSAPIFHIPSHYVVESRPPS